MIRYYILPIEMGIDPETLLPVNARGPKYFRWKYDPDPPALLDGVAWAMMDYGLINAALLMADVTQEQHEALVAEADVASPPQNIDQTISEIAIPQVQNVLEALRIPADWVNTTYTYRQILRMLAGLFLFAQRYHAMHGEVLIDNQAALGLRWNQIPVARRQRVTATADELGYSYGEVQNTWLIRRILFHLAQQWGATPIYIGGVEL